MNPDLYYRITGKHTYQILCTHDYGKKIYVLLDSNGKQCMSVNVDERTISMIQYRQNCPIADVMEHGDTIEMVQSFLRFLAEKETFTTISFVDTSTFECLLESNNDTDAFDILISLPFHNIIVYGNTWYQRHFGAYISDPAIRKLVEDAITRLQTPIDETMTSRFQKAIKQTITQTESLRFRQALQYMLDSMHDTTWMEYFSDMFGSHGSLSKKYGKTMACSLYYTYDTAIIELFDIPFECRSLPMEIRLDTIQRYPNVRIQENTEPPHKKGWSGGKTRRAKRLPKYISMAQYYTNRSRKALGKHF